MSTVRGEHFQSACRHAQRHNSTTRTAAPMEQAGKTQGLFPAVYPADRMHTQFHPPFQLRLFQPHRGQGFTSQSKSCISTPRVQELSRCPKCSRYFSAISVCLHLQAPASSLITVDLNKTLAFQLESMTILKIQLKLSQGTGNKAGGRSRGLSLRRRG